MMFSLIFKLETEIKRKRHEKELGKYYLYPSHKQFPELELEM